jgi:hypothetical protein
MHIASFRKLFEWIIVIRKHSVTLRPLSRNSPTLNLCFLCIKPHKEPFSRLCLRLDVALSYYGVRNGSFLDL